MAKAKQTTVITLEMTPKEAELLWEVLERVIPHQKQPCELPDTDDSRYLTIRSVRQELLNFVRGREDGEEEGITGYLTFRP